MKLKVRYNGGVFSLEESSRSDFGLAFACVDNNPSDDRLRQAQFLTERIEAEIMAANGCNHPSCPDMWETAHGCFSQDEDIEVLEYEPADYPADAVF